MAISFITGNGIFTAGGVSSTATTTSINVAAGDTIVAGVRITSLIERVNSVTDTAGNVYRPIGMANAFTSSRIELWYCTNCAAHATNIITAVFSTTMSFSAIAVAQFRGIATISPVDVSTYAQNISSFANITSPNFTTAVENCVLIAYSQINVAGSAWTPDGSGYAEAAQDASNVQFIQYKIVSTIQTGVNVTGVNASGSDKAMVVISLHEELSGGGSEASSAVLHGANVIPYKSNYY